MQQPHEDRMVSVAVDAPLFTPLTYKSTESWPVGSSVIVPLGKRKVQAVILENQAVTQPLADGPHAPPKFVLKNIESLDETRPPLTPVFLKWLQWVAEYYVHPIGQVMSLAFPPLATKKSARVSKRAPVIQKVERQQPLSMTSEQKDCVENISQKNGFHTHLLFGVTGSGKTEVYLQLLEKILASGRGGLVLVPEISLTPQLINRFAARFGEQVAVLHSHLTDRERTTQWWSVLEKEKRILIGARSALFCPMPDLGLIVVDEEHEASYKQEESLKYHARDAAIVLAKQMNIPILLGSATPSLETWRAARDGRYHLHTLSRRAVSGLLPTVDVVDMRLEKTVKRDNPVPGLPFWLSTHLHTALTETLERKEQVALFLNRRGIAPTIACPDCGHVERCPNCAISLTLHGRNDLVCHYCDYTTAFSATCTSCKIGEVKPLGLGTEQVEMDVQKLFPNAKVARADRDEIYSRETLEDLITRMESHDIDILVGTQMIAKGLDFKKLNLVGLVLADVGFNLPDFRSTERSFQLITQVSGRAGRHISDGGRVIIQTYNPDYAALTYAKTADFTNFAEYELKCREELLYPPYGRLAALRIIATSVRAGIEAAERLAARCEVLKTKSAPYKSLKILGPTEAPLAKLRGKFRYYLLIKSPSQNVLSAFCRQLVSDGKWLPSGTKVQVDIDPLNLL